MTTALNNVLNPRRLPLLMVASAAAVLITANVFEHVFGYQPCQLCLYQRLPWWIALGIGCLAMIVLKKDRPTLSLLLMLVGFAAVAVGAGIAGYHAGVEYGFWEGPSGCTGARELGGGLSEALGQIQGGMVAPSCDTAPWSLFGISMAGYNFLISLGLVALGTWIMKRGAIR